MKVEMYLSDGIVFLVDPTNRSAEVPEYHPNHTVGATDSCVSIATIPAVDGTVTISLEMNDGTSPMRRIFQGSVVTPGRRLALVSSQFVEGVSLDVQSLAVDVSIFADRVENPRKIAVFVQ